jgi:arginyl-tRNA synthetase
VKKDIFKINEKGNTVFHLPESFGKDEAGESRVVTVLRPDGTSLYVTQDIGLAVRRQEEYKFGRLVYVVGSEQNFHFQTLFAILQALGFEWAKKLYHLSYGMVYLPEGKMKSREGTVVDADDLLVQMKQLAKEEIQKRLEGSLEEPIMEKRSTSIALAAIKFYFLRNRPTTDIYFDPKESIAFEGFTGPYLQYTHARIYGILRKYAGKALDKEINSIKYSHDLEASEVMVLRKLHQFPEALEAAAADYLPSMLCKYLFEVAQDFNSFYQSVQVLSEKNEEIKEFRLRLIMATAQVLKNGLTVLGIEAPEEM